jgi:2-polyprenyl-3-methyl-5-hydroxy-6-metoxy-1,4-benzoquinol methylase
VRRRREACARQVWAYVGNEEPGTNALGNRQNIVTVMLASNVEYRARKSAGISNDGVLNMVRRALDRREIPGGCLVDVGCGSGNFYPYTCSRFEQYIGVDAVRYEDFPPEARFCRFDLDSGQIPLPEGIADVVAAVEVIEHLENPRDFMRKLVRLAKPGGWVVVTTPNQLSFLSLLTLVVKNRFQAFQDVHYPTHLTALLEVDLRRIAAECSLTEIEIEYSLAGRAPLTSRHYPGVWSRLFPQGLSDNLLVIGKKKA